jgi:molybdopterin converting factor small subunit
MATVLFFGPARDAAGTRAAVLSGDTVGALMALAVARYGETFSSLLPTCRIWVNGEPADDDAKVADGDEVAVLPPVSGG